MPHPLTKLVVASVVAFAAWVAAPPANATLFTFFNSLDPGQEVPPVASAAIGTVSATYDDVTKIFDLSYSVVGLTTPIVDGHVHNEDIGVNGPVIIDFSLAFAGGISEPQGAFPQTDYRIVFDFTDPGDLAFLNTTISLAAFETELLSEQLYVNVHTETFPEGEVRGQLLLVDQVPEPATLALFGLGLIGLAGLQRRFAG